MDADQEEFYVSPIAEPMASEKLNLKILKLTRSLLAEKLVKRGVKEVVKALRKDFNGVCILAGDVSPVDVISHIPILCEKKGIPYIYVRSRMELGVAAQTKRPTSVVLIGEPSGEKHTEKFDFVKERIVSKNKYIE